MSELGVNAAIAAQTQEMQAMTFGFLHGVGERGIVEELTRTDEQVDARDIHIDDAAGAHVHMTYFAVAHLTFGQPDVRTGGVDQSIGISPE